MMQVLTGEQFIEKSLTRMSEVTGYKFEHKDVNNISYNENVNKKFDITLSEEFIFDGDPVLIIDDMFALLLSLMFSKIKPEGTETETLSYEIGDFTIEVRERKRTNNYSAKLKLPIKFKL